MHGINTSRLHKLPRGELSRLSGAMAMLGRAGRMRSQGESRGVDQCRNGEKVSRCPEKQTWDLGACLLEILAGSVSVYHAPSNVRKSD